MTNVFVQNFVSIGKGFQSRAFLKQCLACSSASAKTIPAF